MNDWQRVRDEALAEQRIDEIPDEVINAERCRPWEPWAHAELARMQGQNGVGRWRGGR